MKILLDSVDTKVDLRNVRMRFLFFETFKFPEATITVQIDPAAVADLAQVRRKVMTLPYTISLHGISKTLEADLALTLIDDDLVAVSTNEPIALAVADFALTEGLEKLQDAASVEIVPSSTVTFDFIFNRLSSEGEATVTATAAPEEPASAALEAAGDFSLEACVGRFEFCRVPAISTSRPALPGLRPTAGRCWIRSPISLNAAPVLSYRLADIPIAWGLTRPTRLCRKNARPRSSLILPEKALPLTAQSRSDLVKRSRWRRMIPRRAAARTGGLNSPSAIAETGGRVAS